MTRSACSIVAVAVLFAAGCSSKPAGSMSSSDLDRVRIAADGVATGTPKAEVLKSVQPANTVKLGSAEIEGVSVEEWKVEAFHDKNKSGRDLFVRFFYFADSKLVDVSDTRVPFREKPELVKAWAK